MSIGKLYFQVKWFQLKEQAKVIRYYRKLRFFLADTLLISLSFFMNPYRVIRKSKQNLGPYGETPLTTLSKIISHLDLDEKETIYELGCGRGRSLFYLASFTPCKVIGIEKFSLFLFFANKIRSLLRYKNISFLEKDFTLCDFSDADVVYLYGTALSDKEVASLSDSLQSLPKGGRVITISFSLQTNLFTVEKQLPVVFSWGSTTAYIQRKI